MQLEVNRAIFKEALKKMQPTDCCQRIGRFLGGAKNAARSESGHFQKGAKKNAANRLLPANRTIFRGGGQKMQLEVNRAIFKKALKKMQPTDCCQRIGRFLGGAKKAV
jgi:hypothetical protein